MLIVLCNLLMNIAFLFWKVAPIKHDWFPWIILLPRWMRALVVLSIHVGGLSIFGRPLNLPLSKVSLNNMVHHAGGAYLSNLISNIYKILKFYWTPLVVFWPILISCIMQIISVEDYNNVLSLFVDKNQECLCQCHPFTFLLYLLHFQDPNKLVNSLKHFSCPLTVNHHPY